MALTVAQGLSNAEAANRLFLSQKTIEFHLGNAFRKLGVQNVQVSLQPMAMAWAPRFLGSDLGFPLIYPEHHRS